jgi:hypothetical protein
MLLLKCVYLVVIRKTERERERESETERKRGRERVFVPQTTIF